MDALPLLAGDYLVTAAVYDTAMIHPYDHRDRQYLLTVQTSSIRERFGTVLIPSHWHHEPSPPDKTRTPETRRHGGVLRR